MTTEDSCKVLDVTTECLSEKWDLVNEKSVRPLKN